MEHLHRVKHTYWGRLLLKTTGPVTFWICMTFVICMCSLLVWTNTFPLLIVLFWTLQVEYNKRLSLLYSLHFIAQMHSVTKTYNYILFARGGGVKLLMYVLMFRSLYYKIPRPTFRLRFALLVPPKFKNASYMSKYFYCQNLSKIYKRR